MKAAMRVELARINEAKGVSGPVVLTEFRLHDLRRVVRTNLSALQVRAEVAEAVIGHGKKGLDRIYNLHRYLPEMRSALQRWAGYLETLIGLPPSGDGDEPMILPELGMTIRLPVDRYFVGTGGVA